MFAHAKVIIVLTNIIVFSFIPDLLPAIETKGLATFDKMGDDIEKQDVAQLEKPSVFRLVYPRPAVVKE